jgi:hypothetical protein
MDAVIPPASPDVQGTAEYASNTSQQPDQARVSNVTKWSKRITYAKKSSWKDIFKQMREWMKFLGGDQWGDKAVSREKYVANIVQRHVQQRVAALYAKDPTFTCKRRRTLDFKIWDGTQETLQELQGQLTLPNPIPGGPPVPNPQPDPNAIAMLEDIKTGMVKKKLYQRIADTMQLIMTYSLAEQSPPFKRQMKQLVRRVCACGVGYVKIGYKRQMQPRPENVQKITDTTQQLTTLQRLAEEIHDDRKDMASAEADELRMLLKTLQAEPQMVVSEGLVFDFPSATSIIVDPKCRHLSSFLGAKWVAEEYIMDLDDVREIYGIDISSKYTSYRGPDDLDSNKPEAGERPKKCCVWEVWDKQTQQVFTIAEGYDDFLKEPASPDVKLNRFWQHFPLIFNETEDEESIFPMSDVGLLMPMQREINRAREGLREHRVANRPRTVGPKGSLDDEDRRKLQTQEAHVHVELGAVPPGGKIGDIIMPWPTVDIDSAVYDTAPFTQDAFAVGGQSEASLGSAQSGVTATGDSIAESNRSSFNGSVIDEMDDMLSELADSSGQILLAEMDPATATKIAGQGAAWPVQSRQEVADELILTVKAGSSGRPNKAAEIDNFNKLAPILMQIPGITPAWMAEQGIKRLDDDTDLSEALGTAAQSIMAMNAMKQVAPPGAGGNDPNLQGPEGAQNAPAAPGPGNPGEHNMSPGAPIAAQ